MIAPGQPATMALLARAVGAERRQEAERARLGAEARRERPPSRRLRRGLGYLLIDAGTHLLALP